MPDECDDARCGAIWPQGHLSGCRNASRPPKLRAGWDADWADAPFTTMADARAAWDARRGPGEPSSAEIGEWTRSEIERITAATEPTDGEAADPAYGDDGTHPYWHFMRCDEHESQKWFGVPWERFWGANTLNLAAWIVRDFNSDDPGRGWRWNWNRRYGFQFMPEFVLFPRLAPVEARVQAQLSEAWRRVNSAVDVLRYGDTGDW